MESKCNKKLDGDREINIRTQTIETDGISVTVPISRHLDGCGIPGTNRKVYRYDEGFDCMYIDDMSEEAIAGWKHFDELMGPDIDMDLIEYDEVWDGPQTVDRDLTESDKSRQLLQSEDELEEDFYERFDRHCQEQSDQKALELKEMEDDGWILIKDSWAYLVPGDTVRFDELVWSDDYFDKDIKGTRINTVYITRRSYSRQLSLRIYFKVIDSFGISPLEKDKQTWRALKTILNEDCDQTCYRKRWADESQREEAVAQCNQNYHELSDEIFKEQEEKREREEQEFLNAFKEGYVSDNISEENCCNDDLVEDDEDGEQVKELSEDEQQWVDSEWYEDVPKRTFLGSRGREWELDEGWTPLFDTYDEAIVGDIIRFSDPIFTGRYPHGKYCGSSIVIAEVVKIGCEYFHMKFLACRGEKPRCKRFIFRRQLGTVYSNQAYRLKWQSEVSRMLEYQRQARTKFSSFEDYVDFVRPNNTESEK